MTTDELAGKIKAKYPAYAEMDNQTLVEKITAKHPEYKKHWDMNYDTSAEGHKARQDYYITQPVKEGAMAGLRAALPSPDFSQPLSPTSQNPAMAGLQAAGQTLRDPTRIAPTTSQPGQIAGQAVEKKLGGGTGAKAAGFVTEMALDPVNLLSGAAGAKAIMKGRPVLDFAGEQAAKLAEGLSNVPLKNIKTLFKNPLEILRAPSSKEAGKVLQTAKTLAGITEDEEFLISKAADRAMGGARAVGEALRPTFKKAPADLTTGELMALKRAAGKLSQAGGSEGALWSGLDKEVSAALKKRASDITDALDVYAKSKTKESFMNLFPRTKAGKVDYFKALGTGYTNGLTSPIAVGIGTLAARGAKEALSPLAKPFGAASGFALSQMLQEADKRTLQSISDRAKKRQ